jgi:hypothetical protein
MIIPSIVKADLIVLRARARPAIFNATSGFILSFMKNKLSAINHRQSA